MLKQRCLDYLMSRRVEYELVEHEPVYTMEDMERAGLDKHGRICKNLFLRDQKGKRHFLVTVDNSTVLSLKTLGETLGVGKLSFASAERLEKYLGVASGCVSPLGVLNDTAHEVTVILDKRLCGERRLGVHPNDNSATVFLSFDTLLLIIEDNGNEATVLEL